MQEQLQHLQKGLQKLQLQNCSTEQSKQKLQYHPLLQEKTFSQKHMLQHQQQH